MTDANARQSATTPIRNEASSRYHGVDRALASLKKRDTPEEPTPDLGAKPPGHYTALAADHVAGRTTTGLPVRPTHY